MKTYLVTVYKTETFSAEIEIEAESELQAESMAEDDAQNRALDWGFESMEFTSYADEIYEEA